MNNGEKKILVVEDDISLLNVLSERLTEEGFSVLKAITGEEGLDLAIKNHPDLILLDIVMPKMDGISMLRKLRSDAWGKKALVILLTNLMADDKMMKAIAELEPAFYLTKTDWKMDDVVERVKRALEK